MSLPLSGLVIIAGFVLMASGLSGEEPGLQEGPLAPRSGPPGKTLFTLVPPAQSGLATENRYDDPRMWGERYHEFGVGAIGTGIAIGDYNRDGWPDVFVVSKTESCRLFRNLGGFKFEDVTEQAGVGDSAESARIWKQGATFADVNNDGRLDLYVCRFAAPNLLYINQGDGTFREEAKQRGLALADASGMAAFCDYDRDGWLDVYVQTNLLSENDRPNGQPDHLYHNNGDGTFADVTAKAGMAGESQGHSATWWDYDNDGWPDLYVANDFAVPDLLYHNNRDGTFTNRLDAVVPHTTFSSMGADLGDVDNDGLIDLFVADMAGSTHVKDQRGMADSRARAREVPVEAATAPQVLYNALFLNTGLGLCREAAHLAGIASTDWTWSPRFEDLDNDGRLDLFVTNGMNREQHNSDLLSRIMAAESGLERARIMRASPVLAEANLAYRNEGDLKFVPVGPEWGLDQKGVSFGSAFADFDGDGDLDVVFANFEAGATLLRNDGDSGHRVQVYLRGTRSNRFGVGAVVRIRTLSGVQVRPLVLARGYCSSSEPMLHFGLGTDSLVRELVVTWPSGVVQRFRDLPADRRYLVTEPADATAAEPAAAPAVVPFHDATEEAGLGFRVEEAAVDESVREPLLPFRQNPRGPAVAVGDIDGVAGDDLVIGGTPASPARLLLSDGSGGFRPGSLPGEAAPQQVSDGPVLLVDLDGDDRNDLLITRGGASLPAGAPDYQPRWYRNAGDGRFEPAPSDVLPELPLSVGAACAADFDRDGRLDVFLGARVLPGQYPLPPRSALLINRGGRFEDVTDLLAPGLRECGMVSSALATDVDGDGWSDLLVALEWGGVRFWRNEEGRRFTDASEPAGFAAAGTGWWTSLASADFNGDGRMDYVAGNVGLNTPYRASPEEPALLFVGLFDDAETPVLVEAYHEEGRLVPWRTRRQFGALLPAILKRFPRNDAYARATLPEIFGGAALEQAERFAATELRSGVFLSGPRGRHTFVPLPRIAQIAPLQGVATGDFDGDGHADIYAAQNSFAPMPFVGRFDGGLSQLLRGDGRGGFDPVPPAASGLVVRGDAKAVVRIDAGHDGWADFLVTRNNDRPQLFRNAGAPGRHAFRVLLRGPAGNLTGIGSVVRVVLGNGVSQSAEIQAGSSYYSQSAAAAFFAYPDGNEPREISVRWPDGGTTQYRYPAGARAVTLTRTPEAGGGAGVQIRMVPRR